MTTIAPGTIRVVFSRYRSQRDRTPYQCDLAIFFTRFRLTGTLPRFPCPKNVGLLSHHVVANPLKQARDNPISCFAFTVRHRAQFCD